MQKEKVFFFGGGGGGGGKIIHYECCHLPHLHDVLQYCTESIPKFYINIVVSSKQFNIINK